MRRNVSHLKKIPRPEQFDSDADDDIQIQPRHINVPDHATFLNQVT